MNKEINKLVDEIANAARKAFIDLFQNKESYYYCVLLTTGEAHSPYISAWSWEALIREGEKRSSPIISAKKQMNSLKYSPADSPYCLRGHDDYFGTVVEMFDRRPIMDYNDEEKWNMEYAIRYNAMVAAMKRLDGGNLFSLNQPRDEVLINVEVMGENQDILAKEARKFNNCEVMIKDYLDWSNRLPVQLYNKRYK
jgi:hypothetical protein